MGRMGVRSLMRLRGAAGAAILALIFSGSIAASPASAQQALPCSFQSEGDYSGSYAKVSETGPYEIGEQEVVELESKLDGVTIQIGLVRPKVPAGTQVPVIANASSYFHPMQTLDQRACRPFLTENFVPHGYAVASIAIRGTADSGGCMNLMGSGERFDLDQAVTWLGTQEWSNGSVGMIGLSYDGATQWEAASFGNEHLKTIVPISGVPDLYELMHGGGRVDWRGPAVLSSIYYLESAGFYAPGRSPQHTAEVTACPEYAVGTAAALYSSTVGGLDPFGYWEERRYRDDILENYRGSVYLVQGLQDWNVNPGQQFPWIWDLEKRGVPVKYLLGQWGHAWPYSGENRMDWADYLLDWFDRELKGDTSAPPVPMVEVQDGTDRWRRAMDWPQGRSITFSMNPGHTLSTKPSKETDSETVATDPFHTQLGYSTSSPIENAACTGTCTYFETDHFADEFRISGLPRIKLTVVPQGPGGQLSVYLYALTDDGMQRLGWGQVDLRFASGKVDPQQVTPGEEMVVKFDAQPLDEVVPQGAHLRVVVSSGSGWNRLPGPLNFPIELAEGKGQSTITVLSPTPAPESFFEPSEGS